MLKQLTAAGFVVSAAGMALAAAPASPGKPRFTVSPETTEVTEPLRPDGMPDYIAAFNARHGKGVTPADNALLPLLEIRRTGALLEKGDTPEEDQKNREAFLQHIGISGAGQDGPVFKTYFAYLQDTSSTMSNAEAQAQWTQAGQSLWTAEKFPELARHLAAQTHFFDLAAEASQRPHFFAPVIAADGHMAHARAVQFVGLSEFGRAWEVRALLRASSGDFDGALADAVALRHLGRLYATAGPTIGVLLGDVYDSLGIQVVGTMAGAGKLSAAQCDRCLEAMKLPAMPNLVESRRFEEWMALDRTLLWARDGIDLKELPDDPVAKALFGSIDTSALDFDIMLMRIRQQFEEESVMLGAATVAECRARADAMAAQNEARLQAFRNRSNFTRAANETPEAYTQRVVNGILAQSAPLADQELRRRAILERSELLPVLLAAAKVKAQTGEWPKSLEALERVQADAFSTDGKAAPGYFVKDGEACLASAGLDHILGTDDDQAVGILSAEPKQKPGGTMP